VASCRCPGNAHFFLFFDSMSQGQNGTKSSGSTRGTRAREAIFFRRTSMAGTLMGWHQSVAAFLSISRARAYARSFRPTISHRLRSVFKPP
jgi:hypothetical protein